MRIKFRIWCRDDKNFSYWGFIDNGFNCIPTGRGFSLSEAQELSEQYTGLKDKNGVEIWEGDIITSKEHNPSAFVVEFIDGGFCCTHGDESYPTDINHFYSSVGCCIEVIGNIHDNPELLEGGR